MNWLDKLEAEKGKSESAHKGGRDQRLCPTSCLWGFLDLWWVLFVSDTQKRLQQTLKSEKKLKEQIGKLKDEITCYEFNNLFARLGLAMEVATSDLNCDYNWDLVNQEGSTLAEFDIIVQYYRNQWNIQNVQGWSNCHWICVEYSL